MSASATWQEGNQRYLAAALAWLRLRLERLGDGDATKDGAIEAAGREADLCESQVEPPPALCALADRLGLSRFERHLLLLCAAMELDTRVERLCAAAQGDASRSHPTFALAMALFDDAAWDIVSPERPLRRWRLIEVHQNGSQPLMTSALRADERIVNDILGLDHLDVRLAAVMTTSTPAADWPPLQPSQLLLVEQIERECRHASSDASLPTPPPVALLGGHTASKRLVAQHAAARQGRRLLHLTAGLLPTQLVELDSLARLWQRECILSPLALFIERIEAGATPLARDALNRFLVRCAGLQFLDLRELQADPSQVQQRIAVEVAKPTPLEQRAIWALALGDRASDAPKRLASQFDLDTATIFRVVGMQVGSESDRSVPIADRLWDACKSAARPALDAMAQRIEVKASWDDIVLPPEPLSLLRQVSAQVRCRHLVYGDWGFGDRMNRGLGICALFGGASGVGKTMAAEVIANDLRLDLYRIDLSSVVSKYIGETEDNLRRVFDAAEDGGAILFFDECDALFGKRSEVKDAHDRYANIQTNYLLQRLEAYRGLAILATNMRSSLDAAFTRRLRFIVDFPFPGPVERGRIWRKAFPPGVPCDRLDLDRLSRMNVSGATIHSAALCASFLAAQAGSKVTMQCVMSALRTELGKLGRPVADADFRFTGDVGMPQ